MDDGEQGVRRIVVSDDTAKAVWKALDHMTLQLGRIESRMPTEDEMRAIREIIEGDRRARWLWETARTWALWVTAVIAGFTVGVDALKALLKRLTS